MSVFSVGSISQGNSVKPRHEWEVISLSITIPLPERYMLAQTNLTLVWLDILFFLRSLSLGLLELALVSAYCLLIVKLTVALTFIFLAGREKKIKT